jgi:hypothetical protein
VSMQRNSTSPISCIKRLGGVRIKVILMCLYKQIVLVQSDLLNASEVWFYPHTPEAFNTADGTSTICLHRHINITFIPTPLRRLIQLMGLVLFVCIDTSI